MKIQNIVFTDHAQGMGGAEQSLLLLMQNLDQERYHPILASPSGPLGQEAAEQGIEHVRLDMPRLRQSATVLWDGYGTAQRLAAFVKANEVDVLVSNTVRASFYTALAARLARTRFVWYMRDFWLSETRPSRPRLDWVGKSILARNAAQVITNSNAVAAHLPPSTRKRVVHNGIDLAAFDPDQDGTEFRRRYNIPLGAPLAGMLGRLRPWKGQARFLHAAAQVIKKVPNAYFVLAGGSPLGSAGNYPESLQKLALELGLENRAVFTGQLEDVEAALEALDLFIHPGDPEPFGLVNLEAMAMRLPVVASITGPYRKLWNTNDRGFSCLPAISRRFLRRFPAYF
jgi:glycosyltransferase involved in cell wall biosynthesis